MHRRSILAPLFVLALLSGCRSPVVAVNITNRSPTPIRNIEVNFPGGTYGVSSIAAGKTFSNRIKVFYAGALQIQYSDASGKIKNLTGPSMNKYDHGNIQISIDEHGGASGPLQRN